MKFPSVAMTELWAAYDDLLDIKQLILYLFLTIQVLVVLSRDPKWLYNNPTTWFKFCDWLTAAQFIFPAKYIAMCELLFREMVLADRPGPFTVEPVKRLNCQYLNNINRFSCLCFHLELPS